MDELHRLAGRAPVAVEADLLDVGAAAWAVEKIRTTLRARKARQAELSLFLPVPPDPETDEASNEEANTETEQQPLQQVRKDHCFIHPFGNQGRLGFHVNQS